MVKSLVIWVIRVPWQSKQNGAAVDVSAAIVSYSYFYWNKCNCNWVTKHCSRYYCNMSRIWPRLIRCHWSFDPRWVKISGHSEQLGPCGSTSHFVNNRHSKVKTRGASCIGGFGQTDGRRKFELGISQSRGASYVRGASYIKDKTVFLVLIGDIDRNVSHAFLSSFADTRIGSQITSPTDTENLQTDLEVVYQWAEDNNMELNADKFEYMHYGACYNQEAPSQYKASSRSNIQVKQHIKDLGITMSSDGNPQTHPKCCSSGQGSVCMDHANFHHQSPSSYAHSRESPGPAQTGLL